jgi:GMP synthase (glutamine-hydrolysing)
MRKDVLIVKNSHEGPGLISRFLEEQGIGYRLVELGAREAFPDPEGCAALVVLGGPDSANDETPKMTEELRRIREALSSGVPYLGICLGLQTLLKAAGGRVVRSPVKEVGFRGPDGSLFTVETTEEGTRDPLLDGLGRSLKVFQLHGEMVELAPGMTLLAEGKFCRNQIVRAAPRAYGLQCHFELTRDMFESWLGEDPDLRLLDAEEMRKDLEVLGGEYESTGLRITANFFRLAGVV